jgi:hypothetical protein
MSLNPAKIISPRRVSSLILYGALVILIASSQVRGEDPSEVKRLKERIEFLETKVKLLELQNEKLQKENSDLKAQKTGSEKETTKKSLSALLSPGTVMVGDWAEGNGGGDVTITILKRDGNKVEGKYVATNRVTKEQYPERDIEGEIEGIKLTIRPVATSAKWTIVLSLVRENLKGTRVLGTSKATMGLKFQK